MLFHRIRCFVKRYKGWWFLLLYLLPACQVTEPTTIQIPTPLPRLAFVPFVHPEPSSTISSQAYFSGVDSNILETTNAICLELDAHELIEDGDIGLGWTNYLERSELIVDGKSSSNVIVPDSYFGSLSEVIYTFYDPDMEELVEGSYAPGPFTFCWEIILDKGLHTIEFQTRKTSGKILSYSWSFYISD